MSALQICTGFSLSSFPRMNEKIIQPLNEPPDVSSYAGNDMVARIPYLWKNFDVNCRL